MSVGSGFKTADGHGPYQWSGSKTAGVGQPGSSQCSCRQIPVDALHQRKTWSHSRGSWTKPVAASRVTASNFTVSTSEVLIQSDKSRIVVQIFPFSTDRLGNRCFILLAALFQSSEVAKFFCLPHFSDVHVLEKKGV